MHPSKLSSKTVNTYRIIPPTTSFVSLFVPDAFFYYFAIFHTNAPSSPLSMAFDDRHPSTSASYVSTTMPSVAANDHNQDIDMSDSDLSQFQAQIEHDLSSASPESSHLHGGHNNVSEEPMDVDTDEEVGLAHVNKGRKKTSTKEYYDPELFGLRRSVSHPPIRLFDTSLRWYGG
jgi:hypothetical protein